MEQCKCGLTWELTRRNVEVSYRGLIRCLWERPLMVWDGFFFYTVERAKASFHVPSEAADPLAPVSHEASRGAVSL